MTGSTPRWWYRDRPSLGAHALRPVAAVFNAITRRRLRQPALYTPPVPVICVGNFTAGGTGKTPLTLALIARLKQFGAQPVVITRGYGGALEGPVLLDPQVHSVAMTGDEPQLLAQHAPVVIARRRSEGGKYVVAHGLGSVILMDDGLQNPGLKKSLTLAVIDGARGFGNELVIPAGPLRADPEAQAAVTDLIVVNHGARQRDDRGARPTMALALKRALERVKCLPVVHGHLVAGQEPSPAHVGPVLAYCGIGAPDRFFNSLTHAGFTVAETVIFPDHHTFSEADAQRLVTSARSRGLALITTAKDAVRVRGLTGSSGRQLADLSAIFHIAFDFDQPDWRVIDALFARVGAITNGQIC